MNLRDLTYLVATAKHLHFGKAAKACFVSQPTLSTQLKKLEEELGVTLFERNNKNVMLTDTGNAIVVQAQKVLYETEQIRRLANSSLEPFTGEFRLGVIPTIGPYLLPLVYKKLKKAMPRLKIFLHEEKTEVAITQLKSGLLDAIIIATPASENSLISKTLFTDPFYLALPNGHPLSKKKLINIDDISKENILLLEEGHCLREQALELCGTLNLGSNQQFHATSLETLRYMVMAGVGITLLPEIALAYTRIKNSELTIKPFKNPSPKRIVSLVWRKHTTKQPSTEKIAEIIQQAIKQD